MRRDWAIGLTIAVLGLVAESAYILPVLAAPTDFDCFDKARAIASSYKDRKFTWEEVKASAITTFGRPDRIAQGQENLDLVYDTIVKEKGKPLVSSETVIQFMSQRIESSAFGGLYHSTSDPILSVACKTTVFPPGSRQPPQK